MKKPNITEGEWEYHKDFTAVTVKKGKMVADCFHAFDMEYEQNANGQAISAVPEMIDALITSTKLLEHLKSVETEAELLNQIEQQIEMNKYSALKKAGVTEL